MQVARAGCRARGCGQSGGSWPWRVCSPGCELVRAQAGSVRFRAPASPASYPSSTAHVVGEPAVGVRVAGGSGCHRRSGPEGRVLRVDEVTVDACTQVREAIDEAVVDDLRRARRQAPAPYPRPAVAQIRSARRPGMSIVNGSRSAVRSARLADVGAHLACPDPRAHRPPGRRTQQYAGKVRAQGATVAPCGYVWSAKAAVVSQMSPHIGAAGFSVRSGRVSAPSRLRSLTWMDPVSDLPSVLLPFPRLWGLRPAVVRFSARRRPSPTRSSRSSGSQPSQRVRDRSIRIVSGVWFDAWNLLVQEGLTAFGLDRSMLSGWIADFERTRCDLGRLIRRLRERGGQWRSRRCAASDERSSPNAAGSFPKASGTT